MKRRRHAPRIASLDLLENSAHLLRGAPAHSILAYYIGSVPFVLGLLYFWSDMSRSPYAERHLVGGALAMSALFIWMKAWQAAFADILRGGLERQDCGESWSIRRVLRVVARQLSIQPSGFLILPIALVLFIPFGWLFTFYQNAVVLGARGNETLGQFIRKAWRQAQFDAMENHLLMFLLLLFGMFVWLNVLVTAFALPFALKTLIGIETPFTLSYTTLFNTTFLAITCGVAYLCIDPIVKAAYILRCFHGESRQSGQDLLVELRKFAAAVAAVVIIASVAAAASADTRRTADSVLAPSSGIETTVFSREQFTPAAPHVREKDYILAAGDTQSAPPDLDRSIDGVLRKPEYTWRSPRARTPQSDARKFKILDRVVDWMKRVFDAIEQFIKKLQGRRTPTAPFSIFSGRGLAYALIVLVAGLIGLLLYWIWRIRWKERAAETVATVATAPPDLRDESITAEQLPEDGWLRLAVEMIERGDLRLALRAFYLASLAHLADRNLVALAKFKSNRDYELELQRRSHALPEVTRLFSENVSTFDRVWYGLHEVSTELVQQFRANVERIKAT